MGDFTNKIPLKGDKSKLLEFFLHRGNSNKNWEKSRIFRYGLLLDFLSKWQKPQQGVVRTAYKGKVMWSVLILAYD
mgnify:CR=1 FL=1